MIERTKIEYDIFSEDIFRAQMWQIYYDYLNRFPEERERLRLFHHLLATGAKLHSRKEMAGHISASALILSPDRTQILQVYNKGAGEWVAPGGHFDLNDSVPARTAQRETSEETQLTIKLHPWHDASNPIPFDIGVHQIPARPEKGEGTHPHIDLRYRYSLIDENSVARIDIDLSEIQGFKWSPIDSIPESSTLYNATQKLQSS